MDPALPLVTRCAVLARSLAAEEGWALDPGQFDLLVALAVTYLPARCADAHIRTVLKNIRHDSPVVEALRQQGAPGHVEEWSNWMRQVQAILRHAGLNWTRDSAVDCDDLAQVALLELARSLPGYRYASRFSTWAYQVITRAVQRHLRDLAAKKRAGEIDRAVDLNSLALLAGEADQPEQQASGRFLTMLVEDELLAAFGRRNTVVFHLWARDDLSAEMISRRIGLSTARIYAIIALAREHLQARATIKQWYERAG